MANGSKIPLAVNADVSATHTDEILLERCEHAQYRSLVEELFYLALCTRPYITYAVAALALQLHTPSEEHLKLVKRVLRYVSGTRNYGFTYIRRKMQCIELNAFVNADWAGDTVVRKSTTGFIISLNSVPISWKSKNQTIVCLSSAEAEYVAFSTCAKEVSCI